MRGGCRYASRRKRLYVSNCRAARRSDQRAAKTYLLLFDYLFGKVAQSKEDVGASSFFHYNKLCTYVKERNEKNICLFCVFCILLKITKTFIIFT